MNYKLKVVFIAVFICSNCLAQEYDWENPAVFEINKMAAHADLFPYESRELAMKNDKALSMYFQSLNGTWKFNWVENPSKKPEGFFQEKLR